MIPLLLLQRQGQTFKTIFTGIPITNVYYNFNLRQEGETQGSPFLFLYDEKNMKLRPLVFLQFLLVLIQGVIGGEGR